MTPDQERRQHYVRLWCSVYANSGGNHPLFAAISSAVNDDPRWEIPASIVTATVRFSADETWARDPALEAVVTKILATRGHWTIADRVEPTVVLSEIAHSATERNQIRAQARRRRGYALNTPGQQSLHHKQRRQNVRD